MGLSPAAVRRIRDTSISESYTVVDDGCNTAIPKLLMPKSKMWHDRDVGSEAYAALSTLSFPGRSGISQCLGYPSPENFAPLPSRPPDTHLHLQELVPTGRQLVNVQKILVSRCVGRIGRLQSHNIGFRLPELS